MSNHSPDPTPALVMPPAGQGSWPRLGADHWDVADPIAMSKNETLKDYLRRARKDATFRAHLLENARSDRKSTRLNSSHLGISYAVFCLKKNQRLLPYVHLPEAICFTSRHQHALWSS